MWGTSNTFRKSAGYKWSTSLFGATFFRGLWSLMCCTRCGAYLSSLCCQFQLRLSTSDEQVGKARGGGSDRLMVILMAWCVLQANLQGCFNYLGNSPWHPLQIPCIKKSSHQHNPNYQWLKCHKPPSRLLGSSYGWALRFFQSEMSSWFSGCHWKRFGSLEKTE